MTYGPVHTRSGTVIQSGTPKSTRRRSGNKANGLLLRGIVVTTYVVDDPAHPEVAYENIAAVYCDCITWTNIPGSRWVMLPKVLVSQDKGGVQEGRVWKPRAAKIDVTQNTVNLDHGTIAANLDGDHVLIGFLNDNLNEPVILKGLPHPVADVGQEDEAAGHRMRLKVADGDPDYWKHHGSFYGISEAGDFVVDLTQAYANDLEANGAQPAPPGDGSAGNCRVKLQAGAKLTVEIDGGDNLELDLKDGSAKLTLGDGAKSAAVAERIEALYTAALTGMKAVFDSHVHMPTGPGAITGPPLLGPAPGTSLSFPSWDSNIASNKLKIPDTP